MPRRCAYIVLILLASAAFQQVLTAGHPDGALLKIPANGKVLHTPSMMAIFWGTEWNDPVFANDIVSGLDTFFLGYSNSDYAAALTEYADKSGPITRYATYLGYRMDLSSAPAPGGLTGAVAMAKACAIAGNNPDPNGIYIVFTSTPKAPDAPGTACGFHTWGTCSNGKALQVAAIPYSTGEIGSGCQDVQDTVTGHSLSLAQIANVAAHELAETITDPRGSGWRDSSGDEIADKCLVTFPSGPSGYPVFSDGSVWKLQGLWSNAAYQASTGAPNRSGQRGCVW